MGFYGGGSAPSQDPRIGEAAIRSAELGEDYLAWMQSQAEITNGWATEDRERYRTVFEPLQDAFIAEAQGYDTPERRAEEARRATADVAQQAAATDAARQRQMARMGVDPRSGAARATNREADMNVSLAKVGASNLAKDRVEAQGRALRADAVNLGSGFAVNPATSMSMANGASASGFNGAMAGQGQMGSLLNTDYQNRLSAWSANNAQSAGLMGGLGSMAGMAIALSSKDYKEDKAPARSVLEAVKAMPVETWKYKDGIADGGHHIGPYAEDFHAATGLGDGRSIPLQDQMGLTLGAVQELAEKVEKLETKGRSLGAGKRAAAKGARRSIMSAVA